MSALNQPLLSITFKPEGVYLNNTLVNEECSTERIASALGSELDLKPTQPQGSNTFASINECGITFLLDEKKKIQQLYIKIADVERPFLAEKIYPGNFLVNMGELTDYETRIGLQNIGCLNFYRDVIGFVAFPSEKYAISMTGVVENLDYIIISWNVAELKKNLEISI